MGAHAGIRGAALAVTLLGSIAEPASARAQTPGAPPAAQALEVFEKAQQAIERKQYDVACPGFLKSYTLDRTKPGALHALADCYADQGKIASAVARYQEYVQAARALPPGVQVKHRAHIERATAQLAALEPEVPKVSIVVSGPGAPGARVVLDGSELQGASLEASQSLDPGEHRVKVTSSEGVTVERVFTVERAEKKSVDIEIEAKPSAVLPDPAQSDGISGQRIGAIAAFGVGAAGLLVMGITGGIVLGNKSAVHEACSKDLGDGRRGCTTQDDADRANTMYTLGLVSNVSLGVGIAGVALGAVLLATEPKKAERAGTPSLIAVGPIRVGHEGVLIGAAGVW